MNNPEQKLYESIYSDSQYNYYGRSNHGKKHFNHIIGISPTSLLDVGCGHNDFVQAVKDHNIYAVGVDFACDSADIVADILDLPFIDKEFDLITAWDTLEHLLEDQVAAAFKEMKRVSYRFAFTIAYELASTPPPKEFKNHNLHQCVHPASWWHDLISQYGTVSSHQNGFWLGKWND